MIEVRCSTASYAVRFVARDHLLRDLPQEAFVITDSEVERHFPVSVPHLAIPAGESSKNLDVYRGCVSWLARNRASRKATLVALGGGVVGDLAGFVAASYMRGIRLIQIPTTLLAQVDSSVGGKVGLDLPEGKNLIGAFLQPAEVRVSTAALETLPPRQFTNGMAEVLKYGLIMDPALYLELSRRPLSPDDPRLESVVRRCIGLKAQVVEEDEFETTGRRAILNYGHTVGHAIEHALGYTELLHGEAISIGMVVEAKLGERLGITPKGTTQLVAENMRSANLPVTHPILANATQLIDAMYRDKKATSGRLAFSLLTEVGQCKLVPGVEESDILAVLGEL